MSDLGSTYRSDADLPALRSDMQDVLYGAIYHDRFDTSAEALDALLPIVERYAAAKTVAELRTLADKTEAGADDYILNGASDLLREAARRSKRDAARLRARADELARAPQSESSR